MTAGNVECGEQAGKLHIRIPIICYNTEEPIGQADGRSALTGEIDAGPLKVVGALMGRRRGCHGEASSDVLVNIQAETGRNDLPTRGRFAT
jgi:hypothetical protein